MNRNQILDKVSKCPLGLSHYFSPWTKEKKKIKISFLHLGLVKYMKGYHHSNRQFLNWYLVLEWSLIFFFSGYSIAIDIWNLSPVKFTSHSIALPKHIIGLLIIMVNTQLIIPFYPLLSSRTLLLKRTQPLLAETTFYNIICIR